MTLSHFNRKLKLDRSVKKAATRDSTSNITNGVHISVYTISCSVSHDAPVTDIQHSENKRGVNRSQELKG